jgi:hypothetical protein
MKKLSYIFFIFFLFVSAGSFAQNPNNVSNYEILPGKECNIIKDGFTRNIVSCVDVAIRAESEVFINSFADNFGDYVAFACIVAIIILGFKIMIGFDGRRLKPDLAITIFKLMIVSAYAGNGPAINDWKDKFMDLPYQFYTGVSDAVSQEALGFYNPINAASAVPNPDPDATDGEKVRYAIFEQIDNQIKDLVGFKKTTELQAQDANGNPLTQNAAETPRSLMMIVIIAAGLFFTGSLGAMFTMIVVGIFLTLFMALVHMVLFMTAVAIGTAVLFCLTPLMLPLMLFPQTKGIFKSWMMAILTYPVQGILYAIIIFMCFAVLREVTHPLEGVYKEIFKKMGVDDNKKLDELTIIKCPELPFQTSGDIMDDKAKADSVQAGATKMELINTTRDGAGTIANIFGALSGVDVSSAELSDATGLSSCEFKVPVLLLNTEKDNTNPSGDITTSNLVLTDKEMMQLMSLYLCIILIFIFMVSILSSAPEYISQIVGRGGSSIMGVTGKISGNLEHKIESKVDNFAKKQREANR